MVNKLEKYLRKRNRNKYFKIMDVVDCVQGDNPKQADLKKLKGFKDIFRARCGKTRIFFRKIDGKYILIEIKNRDDQTYRNL